MAYFDKYGVEFSDDRKTLVRCPEDFQGEYVIPDGVTSIRYCAFSYCSSLTSITIPNSVTCIGGGAFSRCRSLTSVNIPSGVTSIGDHAFDHCSGLTTITIGKNVTNIGESPFRECCKLILIDTSTDNSNYCSMDGVLYNKEKTILIQCSGGKQGSFVIPNSVMSIEPGAFWGCRHLTSVTIPDSVTSIGEFAFPNCDSLTSITIPKSVTSIGRSTFSCCTGLTSVTIPNSVTSIGNGAFSDCSSLTSIAIPNNVTNIGVNAFERCSGLTSVTIPNSVISIGDFAFCYCDSLKSVTIGTNVTSIGFQAFARGPFLTSVIWNAKNCEAYSFGSQVKSFVFGNEVEVIPAYICQGMNKISSIIIPDKVTSIGKEAFAGCSDLRSIIVDAENRIYDSRDNCNAIIETTSNILILGCNNSVIPNSVICIGEFAFSNCDSLTSIEIPNSVTGIGYYAFNKCTSLISVTIPDSVTWIGEYAFNECSVLTTVIIPNSVTKIGSWTFNGCTGLTSVAIPNSVTDIYFSAFKNCCKLSEIIVPVGQEERFCKMEALHEYRDIIRKTAEKRRLQEEQKRRLREEQEQQLLMEQQMQKMLQGSILFFDTETTGTPRNYRAPVSDSDNWPRLVQLAWVMADKDGNILKKKSVIIKPNGFSIPSDASVVHGITTERALREGKLLSEVLKEFATDLSFATQVVGHNIDFDQRIVGAELYRLNMDYDALMNKPSVCTMVSSTDFCAIPNPNPYFGGYKWPSLSELHRKLFGRDFSGAHDALADITATKNCFFELKRRGII